MALAERVRPFLTSTTFLGGLPESAVDALIRKGHLKEFAKGETICHRGDPGDSLMMIITGRVKVSNINSDGKEIVLNFLGPGDLNGEIAVLDGQGRTANVTAIENSEVFLLYARDLLPTISAHSQVMLEIMQVLCDKLRSASAIIEDNALEMRERVAKGLLRLAQQVGRKSKGGIRLDLTISQTELGNYLGLSRANMSRQLARLKEANVIKIQAGQILIVDEQGLSEIAEPPSTECR